MNATQRRAIYEIFHRINPSPKTELNYGSNFELLIAVMLSAQATDISVNKATAVLFPIANTPQTLLNMGETALLTYTKTLNLFRTKTKHILRTCELLLEHHQGQVPDSREALEALPGVGRKTANVVLNTGFGHATVAVDTHIFRVANRTGLAKGKTPQAVETALVKSTPKEYLQNAHHWLVLHGRYICKARRPECWQCVIQSLCEFPEKNLSESSVAKPKKIRITKNS